MQDNPDLANLSHQVITEQTPQGLRIQLVDQDGRPMFQQGTTEPMPYTKKLLAAVGGIIDSLPNRVSISGHTAAMTMPQRRQLGIVGGPRQCRPAPCCRPAGWVSDRIYEVAGKAGFGAAAAGRPQRLGQPAAFHRAAARSPARAAIRADT